MAHPHPDPFVGLFELETWRGLVIAPEERCSEYNRRDYYPSGSSKRLEPQIIEEDGPYSPYTLEVFEDPSESTVEHIVALMEAHDSGLCAASGDVKREFGKYRSNLTLASPEVNRSKGALDASDWLPPENRCWFAETVLEVRLKYGLTIDIYEVVALERVLRECEID